MGNPSNSSVEEFLPVTTIIVNGIQVHIEIFIQHNIRNEATMKNIIRQNTLHTYIQLYQKSLTLSPLIAGDGRYNQEGPDFLRICYLGLIINEGGWKNERENSKFSLKVHEIKKIRR